MTVRNDLKYDFVFTPQNALKTKQGRDSPLRVDVFAYSIHASLMFTL